MVKKCKKGGYMNNYYYQIIEEPTIIEILDEIAKGTLGEGSTFKYDDDKWIYDGEDIRTQEQDYYDADGNLYYSATPETGNNFLPPNFFGTTLNAYRNIFSNTFLNTKLLTECPSGTTEYNMDSRFKSGLNNKAVCEYNIVQENLGDGTPASPTTYIDNATAITLGTPTRIGYDFVAWYDNSNLTGTPVLEIPAYSYGAKTVYAQWTPKSYQCLNGQWLPKGNDWATNNYDGCTQCPANSYCPAGNYTFNETSDQGLNVCPVAHPFAPAGMWVASQCGRKMHIGDNVMYLHQSPATPLAHKLSISYNNTTYSANAVPRDMNSNTFPKMSTGAEKGFHVMIGDVEYLVCDDSVPECRDTGGADN